MSTDGLRASLKAAALEMAGRGWPVFPLRPGTKSPLWHGKDDCPGTGACTGGHAKPETLASTDLDRIAWCWDRGPWNIAVYPGRAGLFIVDCDIPKPGSNDPDGWTQLTTLAAERGGPLPDTWTVRTPSGGRQLWYAAPPGCRLRGTVKHIASNVDTRGWGTYGLAPGSVRPDGAYELFDDTDPVETPAWIVQANCERLSPAVSGRNERAAVAVAPYVAAALRDECARVRAAKPGQRNKVLSTAAYALGQLVGAEVLDEHTARRELETAWAAWGDTDSAGKDLGPGGVIDTSLRAGIDNPRRITPRRRNVA